MRSRTFNTLDQCMDHLLACGYTHINLDGVDTSIQGVCRWSGLARHGWRWRFRDGGASVWCVTELNVRSRFGQPVRRLAPTGQGYTTLLACASVLRTRGYTHAVGVDADGGEKHAPIPLRALAETTAGNLRRYRVDGAAVLRREGDDGPARVLARAVHITTAWHWMLHDDWLDSVPAESDRALVSMAATGYAVRPYCGLCGASLMGATEASHEVVVDYDRRTVHVLERACVQARGTDALPSTAELGAAPRPTLPTLPRTAWEHILASEELDHPQGSRRRKTRSRT